MGDPYESMRAGALAALVLLLVLSAACSTADGGDGVTVRVITPPPSVQVSAVVTPTPVPPALDLSAERVYQGGAVLVSVLGTLRQGTASFIGRDYPLTQGARSLYAFIGVDADDPSGAQPLKVDFVLTNGSKGTLTATVEVLKTEWTIDAITLTPSLSALLDPGIAAQENALLKQTYAIRTGAKLWDGPWVTPAEGSITTRFGEQRSFNGAPASGHHTGTDIGAAEGTPVVATNSGRVVLAQQMRLRGNTVVIDHGGGLLSGYAHMVSFAVAEGQLLRQGDVIGYVGNTGLSTGAHLHWEMSANGVLLDALRFTDGTNGF